MKRKFFTLVEVVVALAILSISIAAFLQLLSLCQRRAVVVVDLAGCASAAAQTV